MGCLRVGTLHDFRRQEHRDGISDPQEGKKTVAWPIEKVLATGINDPNSHKLSQFGIMTGPTEVQFENITIARSFDFPDCFLYCMSHECSRVVMRQFAGADSCVEIINPNGFFQALTEVLNEHIPVTFQGIHECQYQERTEEWNHFDWGTHPAIIKEPIPRFIAQKEIRALWFPRYIQNIEPMNIGFYQLARFCNHVIV